jgi:general stress protein 26
MTQDLEFLRRAFKDVPDCRIATLRADGAPHVAARWFVWLEDGLFVATRTDDATWEHVHRDPRACVLIDRGRAWTEIAGVRLDGTAEPLSAEHPDLRGCMSTWHEKYRTMLAGDAFERLTEAVPALGFLRVIPEAVDTWDHR